MPATEMRRDSDKVEMEYTGPGTKPPNIKVYEGEVDGLEKTGLWARATSAPKTGKSARAGEEVNNG